VKAPFAIDPSKKIGEIWFEPELSFDGVLVKYLFTSEKLSVQVHPSDCEAQDLGLGKRGKEECWLVLEAEPGAAVALGLNDTYDQETVREAAADGSIEDLLVWHEAKVGDFFHVPPGTVHAIGPGLTLLEIQQSTDITFRLFDYGRPRELHLDQALKCSHLEPYSATRRRNVGEGTIETLIEGGAFSVKLLGDQHLFAARETALVVPLWGHVEVNDEILEEGSCWQLEPGDVLRSLADARFVLVRDNTGIDDRIAANEAITRTA
jgi:mannose-6-phosphate isomerase